MTALTPEALAVVVRRAADRLESAAIAAEIAEPEGPELAEYAAMVGPLVGKAFGALLRAAADDAGDCDRHGTAQMVYDRVTVAAVAAAAKRILGEV